MSETLRPLISAPRIRRRVAELARLIDEDHRGRRLVLVVVLKGAAIFAADLMRRLTVPFVVDFVRASSYGDAAHSSGAVKLDDIARLDIAARHVLIVEDIVDTGATVAALADALRGLGPASVDVCALLHKAGAAETAAIRYRGFAIGDGFVVGYGLDYAERYRNLPGIYELVGVR